MKDKIVQIKLLSGTVTAGMKSLIAMSASNKVSTLMLDVQANSVPTVVRGFNSDFSKAKTTTGTFTINYTNLAIEDQYGRVMSDSAVATWLNLNANTKIEFTEDNTNAALSLGTTTLNASGDSITVTKGSAKGSESLNIKLVDAANVTLAASAVDQTIRVTDGTEYVSYTVDAIGKVYDEVAAVKTNNAAYTKIVKVYGVLSNGGKIQLSNGTDYVVNALSNTVVNDDVYLDSDLDVTAALSGYGDNTEFTVPVTVTINKTGEQIAQDAVFSKAAPKVASVKVVDVGGNQDSDAVTDVTAGAATFSVASLLNNVLGNVYVFDQYGAYVQAASNGAVAFADSTNVTAVNFLITPVTGSITIAGNGSAVASVSGLDAYEQFDVKITYPGNVSTTVRVTR